MVPKQVWYRFPGIDYCIVSIQRGKVPIPSCHTSGRKRGCNPRSSLAGYMEVVQIPRGSVHIEIREVAMSKNYIGKWWTYTCDRRQLIKAVHERTDQKNQFFFVNDTS